MHYKDYKTILSPKNGMNLYRGCSHGCIYCDSRSICYQMDHDFEDIEVKRDAIAILEDQLRRKRVPCMIGTGAMTDPYIPLELELQLTKQSLELIERYGFGVAIQTKSASILRDIDILARINNETKCVVQITLTTHDDSLCKIVEPNVSLTSERIQVLHAMKARGIPTVVWLSPILPFINDTEENIKALLDECIAADVKGILCFNMGMTLRDGDREYYYRCLDRHFPGLKQRYVETFGNAYVCDSPNAKRLMQLFIDTCKQHGMLYHPDDVFSYLHQFEAKQHQLSLF